MIDNTLDNTTKLKPTINAAKRLLKRINWLSDPRKLESRGGREFGRSIESNITTHISRGKGILRIQLRKQDAAVVMSMAHYEELVDLKEIYSSLLEDIKSRDISKESDEFEALYSRIASPVSIKASDSLFSATADDLRESYEPGKTETK